MKAILKTLSVLVILLGFCIDAAGQSYEPEWESLAQHETPEWFEDAVLGIYFHWGIYSVPAFGCWGGRNMYMPDGGTSENWGHIEDKYKNTHDYVKKVYGDPGLEFGYKNFVPMFKAEKWAEQFDCSMTPRVEFIGSDSLFIYSDCDSGREIRLHRVEGGNHDLNQENDPEFYSRIWSFLKSQ